MKAVVTLPAQKRPNAAATKGMAKTSAASHPMGEHSPADLQAVFGQIESLLKTAHSTDEDHPWSGDSDRLLRLALSLAGQSHAKPPVGHEVWRVAHDVAALIRAARMVPGDKESLQRQVMLDQAAVHLSWIVGTEAPVGGFCDPGVPRPAAPNSTAAGVDAKIAHEVDCIELARQSTYEIQKLAETMQGVAAQFGNEEHPITHGLMARIIALSEITFHAAALHGEGRAESIPLEELRWAFKGRL